MDGRWYPVVVSALIVGCGGDVDTGHPDATGGQMAAYYGIRVFTGGSAGIDTGMPTETGGVIGMFYGPPLVTGGTSTGGTASTGGASSTIDIRACLADSDCTQCVYITAPSNSGECDHALGCCGGQVMNKETCTANQAAWEANCSGQGYSPPDCPCIIDLGCSFSCKSDECGYWCSS